MDYYALNKRYLEFEKEQGLNDHAFRGIYYWNLIRPMTPAFIHRALGASGGDIAQEEQPLYYKKRFRALIRAALYSLFHPKRVKKATILFAHREQYKNIDGTYVDPFLDFIEKVRTAQDLFEKVQILRHKIERMLTSFGSRMRAQR